MQRRTRGRQRRDRREEPVAELQMTPMIDVTFLLLIFFLCTIRFKTLEGKLAAFLPKDVGPNSDPDLRDEPLRLTLEVAVPGLRVDARGGGAWSGVGRYALSDDRALTYRVGPRAVADLDALRPTLIRLREAAPDRDVVLDARPGVVQAEAIAALDALLAAGFDSVRFAASAER